MFCQNINIAIHSTKIIDTSFVKTQAEFNIESVHLHYNEIIVKKYELLFLFMKSKPNLIV